MVCWPDLLPTFIELAGGKVPAGLDGRSFAGVLRGTTTAHRDRVFTTHSGDGNFNVNPLPAQAPVSSRAQNRRSIRE